MRTHSSPRRAVLATASLAVVLALVAGGCGGSDDADAPRRDSSTTTAVSESSAPLPVGAAYAEAGPYPVGVVQLALADKTAVEVWYPAAEGTTGTDTYSVRDFLPAALQQIVPADVDATHTAPAARDAAGADGRFPVVLFSHGFSGFRKQSSFLTAHLASWGFVVAAPDHASRSLASTLGGSVSMDQSSAATELRKTLDLVRDENDRAASPLAGHVDDEHVVAVGHSAGGATVLQVAADADIDGYVSMASANRLGGGATTSSTMVIPLPEKPSLWLAGANDQVVDPQRTRESFDDAPSPSFFWEIARAGHNAFDDFCTMGAGSGGLVGLADQAGLGAAIPESLRTLATDGCEPPNQPVEEVWPAISHSVVAFARYITGEDREPVALGAEAAADIDGVTVDVVAHADA